MSFQTGLSGLNASSKSLDVIGNNIANANTVGMKASRAEFADLVASSLGAGTSNGPGIGVAVATISQQFTQGNVTITGNSLDIAINGGGFFQMTKTDGSTAFSRDGQFKLDKDGNIINNSGSFLMGYPTDELGVTTSITPQKLTVPTGAPIAAKATTTITSEFNVDARVETPTQLAAKNLTPAPRSTYGTSITTYDSQGKELPVTLYFTKIDPTIPTVDSTGAAQTTDQWAVYNTLDLVDGTGATIDPIGYMAFDSTGKLQGLYADLAGTAPTDPITTNPLNFGNFKLTVGDATSTAGTISPLLDLSNVTQYGVNFAVSNLTQDGYTSGEFTGLSIDGKGVITTRYSNGQTKLNGGMVALADFRNLQGLGPMGSGEYIETYKSGPPVMGQPSVGRFGELRAGAVEESNVDLTSELVNMMTAQRNYQANAQTIKTQDQIMSTLVNLR